jgi:predicted negative regulator of RcsB-dependent stress response
MNTIFIFIGIILAVFGLIVWSMRDTDENNWDQ